MKKSKIFLFFSIHHSYLSDSTYGPSHYSEYHFMRHFMPKFSSKGRQVSSDTRGQEMLPLMLVFLSCSEKNEIQTWDPKLWERGADQLVLVSLSLDGGPREPGVQISRRRHWVSQRSIMSVALQVLEKLQTGSIRIQLPLWEELPPPGWPIIVGIMFTGATSQEKRGACPFLLQLALSI